MEDRKYQSGGSSSSSFTEALFGPKDGRTSSSGLFGSVFGPSSTGIGSSNKQDFGSPELSRTDYKTPRIKCEMVRNSIYQTETAEPSYFSSSIYYGGQEVYPPTNNNTCCHRQRGGSDEDPDVISASRGNWWQGSLYY